MAGLRTLVPFLFFVTARVGAQGGPPLATDDPGTPGNRRWEINLAFTLEDVSGRRTFQAPLMDANYGVGERIQLKVEVPWVAPSPAGERRAGVGNALLGVKWRFRDEGQNGLAMALYPQLRLRAPGDASDEDVELLLPLSVRKNLGFLSVNAEVGYTLHRDRENAWISGLALGRGLAEGLEAVAELFATSGPRLGPIELLFHVGARYELGKSSSLLFAVGRGLGRPSSDLRLDAYLGGQLRF